MKIPALETLLSFLGLNHVQHAPIPPAPIPPRLAQALETLRQEQLHWRSQGLTLDDIKATVNHGRQ